MQVLAPCVVGIDARLPARHHKVQFVHLRKRYGQEIGRTLSYVTAYEICRVSSLGRLDRGRGSILSCVKRQSCGKLLVTTGYRLCAMKTGDLRLN
jgi:hypothetical protein